MVTGGRLLIGGMGNPLLGDDGAGLQVLARLEGRVPARLEELCPRRLDLLDWTDEADELVLIDAISTPAGSPGDWYRFWVEAEDGSRPGGSHGLHLGDLLCLARRLGGRGLGRCTVYAIEIDPSPTFGAALSPPIERAVDEICAHIIATHGGVPCPTA